MRLFLALAASPPPPPEAGFWGDPSFSAVFAGGYLGLLSLMWLGLMLGVGQWGRAWRREVPTGPPPERGMRVSICVPARNEGHQIGACVAACLESRWPLIEVVVVDDRSEDDTAAAAQAADDGTDRLRVVQGSEPPQGWAGKPWACHRAAAEAQGAALCFVDADVVLHPDAIRALVAELEGEELALVSAFGTWELRSFWERAVVPAVGWLIRGSLDLKRVHDPGRTEAFANGQVLMVERGAYEAAGGHEAVAGEVLDDVRLAQVLKRRGGRVGLRVMPWAFRVRLYRNLREIVEGYSKNLYEGMGRRPSLGVGAILFIFVGTLLPWLGLGLGLGGRLLLGWTWPGGSWLVWLGVLCLAQLLFRYRLDRHDGRSGREAWTHPLANLVLVWILGRSVFGLRSTWKGRRFVDGKAASARRD